MLVSILFWNYVSHTKQLIAHLIIAATISNPPTPQVNHDIICSHNNEWNEGGKAEKYEDQGGVHCDRKGWRGGGEYQGGRIRRTRKEVVVCVQSVVGKKKLLIQFEDRNRIDMSASYL